MAVTALTRKSKLNIREKMVGAVHWTGASAVARAAMQLAQLGILARILEPSEFGLAASVAVVISFVGLFSDFGIGSAYVQKRDVTLAQRSSLFWLSLFTGFALTTAAILVSPFLAAAFGDQRLWPLISLASVVFLLNASAQQVRMDTEKRLEFGRLAAIETVASLVSFVVAIGAAWGGLGALSLVLGPVSASLLTVGASWLFLRNGWRPAFHFNFAEIASFLSFGISMIANSVVGHVTATADLVLGLRLLGTSEFGLYSVPRNFVLQVQMLINPIATRIGFPLIAHLQNDLPTVKDTYRSIVELLMLLNAPIYLAMAFLAEEIVGIVLGSRWVGYDEVFRILAIWGLARSTMNPLGILVFGLGRPGLALRWNLVQLLILIPVLILGSHWGPSGFSTSLMIFTAAMVLPSWFFLVRPLCEMRFSEFAVSLGRPFCMALMGFLTATLIVPKLDGHVLSAAGTLLVAIPMYVALVFVFDQRTSKLIREVLSGYIRR